MIYLLARSTLAVLLGLKETFKMCKSSVSR